MEIWAAETDLPAGLESVATIGIFDGVHKGHQRILKTVVGQARQRGVSSVAMTFDPHPSYLHAPDNPTKLIQPLADRLHTIAALGIDAVWVVPYTWDLAGLGALEFIEEYFVRSLGVQAMVVGEDIRFGRHNQGTIETLCELGQSFDFRVQQIPDILDTDGQRYSSTRVRELLGKGQVASAANILGRSYRLRGVVESGFQRGRQLGFPTANLGQLSGLVLPADGVYAGILERSVPGTEAVEHLPSAISVGTNPQFDGQMTTVEAHVLGRSDLNLYGESVAIDFREHLRPIMKFKSVEELLAQMDQDILHSAEILGVPPTGRVDPAAVTAMA